jgi:hypothetical protein
MACAALLAGLLAGCSEAAGKEESKASAGVSASAGGTAESGGTLGAAGSACELPVTFELAEDWEPEAVEAPAPQASGDSTGSDEELTQELLDEMLRQGPVTAACEIDAKPAGHIGFLRIWTGEAGNDDARTVLEAFVADDDAASKPKYGEFTVGDLAGVEVEYTSKALDEKKQEHAFAVATPDGPVVVHLGGLDTEEHQNMLPAYELAKKTVRVA